MAIRTSSNTPQSGNSELAYQLHNSDIFFSLLFTSECALLRNRHGKNICQIYILLAVKPGQSEITDHNL